MSTSCVTQTANSARCHKPEKRSSTVIARPRRIIVSIDSSWKKKRASGTERKRERERKRRKGRDEEGLKKKRKD